MQPTSQISRRSFLGSAPVVGAGVVAAAPAAEAQANRQQKPGDVFRVGCLNVSSYSHLEPIWAPLINPRPGTGEIPFTGMRITHCWEIDPERSKTFAQAFGCEAVPNFDDMLGPRAWTESRRRFLPTITTGDNGEPIGEQAGGVQVEYWDADENKWTVTTEKFDRLPDECGIYFNDDPPPGQLTLHTPLADAKVRITATIRGDRRTSALASRPDDSPNKDEIQVVLDMPGRFKSRTVFDTSPRTAPTFPDIFC